VELVGVVDINPQAQGIRIAREKGIPVYFDLNEGIEKAKANLIINVTGDEGLTHLLMERLKDGVPSVMGGDAARLLWVLVEEKRKNLEDLARLYQIGIQISSFTSTNALFAFFLTKAIELTGTDAASIALYNEKLNELKMVAAEGFSERFTQASLTWKVRRGGLTATILNNEDPIIIEDTESHPSFTNPILKKEGVKALMALTIKSENRIIGISYVDSFTPKNFQKREVYSFKLLSTQAAVAIEKTRILEEIHKLAYVDELTGLNNYRYFLEWIRKELKRSERYSHPFTLLLLDIDHFKSYNDRFGHEAGNYILSKIGSMIKGYFRSTDITVRYGGEEFAVVVTETDKENAFKKVERFREYCSEELKPEKDQRVFRNITISGGLASYPRDSTDLHELIRRADDALYRAKREERDRIVG
jgi:diguanylate cyclase (GGDEF)-like protein